MWVHRAYSKTTCDKKPEHLTKGEKKGKGGGVGGTSAEKSKVKKNRGKENGKKSDAWKTGEQMNAGRSTKKSKGDHPEKTRRTKHAQSRGIGWTNRGKPPKTRRKRPPPDRRTPPGSTRGDNHQKRKNESD